MTPHPQAEILRAIADGEEIEAFYDGGLALRQTCVSN